MEKSLFISSFDSLLYRVYGAARHHWGLGSYYVWHYALLFFLFLLLALLWCRFRKRFQPRWRHFSMAVLVVLLARVFLFDTPFAWRDYKRVTPEDSLIRLTAKQTVVHIATAEMLPRRLNYLIVGSSLTFGVLRCFETFVPQTEWLFVYGMRAVEYNYCTRIIESRNPSRILLSVALYDLANVPWPEKYEFYYSFEDIIFPTLYVTNKHLKSYSNPKMLFMKSLTGWIFPELRYSFVFREYLNRFFGRPTLPLNASKKRDEYIATAIERQKGTVANLSQESLDLSLSALDHFFRFCDKKGIDVVVIEGQINPLAFTPGTHRLNGVAMKRLERLADQYEHVRFVPASELVRLEPGDFEDMIHANEEASRKYSECVFKYLQEHPPFPKS